MARFAFSKLSGSVAGNARSLFTRTARAAFRPTLPKIRGKIRVNGIFGDVQIQRDEWGIPVITAKHDSDAWFGLGFCHGQDRAGQLEILLRVVRGTVSEVAGKDGIGIDRLSRRIGFMKAARTQYGVADASVRSQLDAYARGVNAGARAGGGGRAPDFLLLRTRPTPWAGVDVQAVSAMLCFSLAANWDAELVRLKVLLSDGPEALAALDTTYPEHLAVTAQPGAAAGEAIDRLARDLADFGHTVGHGGGSNAWVLAGSKTQSGRPIVANDPHLAATSPCFWHLAHVRTPNWAVAGASFVGTAAIAAGHNGCGAWGVTAAHADNTDLFVEEIGPDGVSVRDGDAFVPCHVRKEVIRVRGGEDFVEEVLETPRGPIISPVLNGATVAVSLSATWLHPRPYTSFYGIESTQSFREFRECFRKGSTATGSFVYAHESGDIGWFLGVELPQRKAGSGTIPLPGWSKETGWEEQPVSFDDLPWRLNPEEGFLSTANNQPESDGAGVFLGVDFLDGYRQSRISSQLQTSDTWTLAQTTALQMDTTSLPWLEMRDSITALTPTSGSARRALELLQDWDGAVDADSAAASVYELFITGLTQKVIEAKAPNSAHWLLGRGATELLPYNLLITRRLGHVVRLVQEQPDGFFDKGWDFALTSALARAVDKLVERFGEDDSAWAWGDVRPVYLEHTLGTVPPLDRIYNIGPIRMGGDASTIHAASVDFETPTANAVGIPSLRFVIDVGNWSASRFILVGGQSGHPFSPHYADMVDMWTAGDGVPIPWTDGEIETATVNTLSLVPK